MLFYNFKLLKSQHLETPPKMKTCLCRKFCSPRTCSCWQLRFVPNCSGSVWEFFIPLFVVLVITKWLFHHYSKLYITIQGFYSPNYCRWLPTEPDFKYQKMQWGYPKSQRMRKCRTQPSAGKLIVIVFIDCHFLKHQ